MRTRSLNRLTAAVTLSLFLGAAAVAGAAAEEYRDGAYVAVSDTTSHGYLMAVVMVTEGRIAQVRLTEMDGFGNPKPATYPWQPYHEAMSALPGMFIEANSWDVDLIASATGTSTSARTAVRRALEKALGTGTGRYFDGTFFGRSPADDHGFGTALVTIKDDAIVAVTLGEALPDGTWKDFSTYPYEPTVRAKTEMEEAIVAAQGVGVEGSPDRPRLRGSG